MREVSDQLIVCTDDGSAGRKALVTEPLKELLEAQPDVKHIWAIGPAIMMKFVTAATKPYNVPTTVSLNTIMIDGTGMCGGCRVVLDTGTQFVCVDGPEFDAHRVDWIACGAHVVLSGRGKALDRALAAASLPPRT